MTLVYVLSLSWLHMNINKVTFSDVDNDNLENTTQNRMSRYRAALKFMHNIIYFVDIKCISVYCALSSTIYNNTIPSSDHVRQKYKSTLDIQVMYEDLPTCDFKSLFILANGEFGKLIMFVIRYISGDNL